MKYNANLKRILKESGVTQRELGKQIGEHESIICLLINGRYEFPENRLKDLKTKIARTLKVNINDI